MFQVASATTQSVQILPIYSNLHYFGDLETGIKARVRFEGIDSHTQDCNMQQKFFIHVVRFGKILEDLTSLVSTYCKLTEATD